MLSVIVATYFMFMFFLIEILTTRNMFGLVAGAGGRVEDLANTAAPLTGLHPVETDVVAPAGGRVGQGQVDAQLAPGTPEPVLQSPRALGVRRGLAVLGALLLLLLPPSLLSVIRLESAARPARVPGPDTDPLRLRVVETLGAAGGAAHTFQAGVEHVALVGQLTGVDTILAGTVGITRRKDGSGHFSCSNVI